jgi:hypothetical protein
MNSLRERVASASSSAARSKTGFFFLPGAESQRGRSKTSYLASWSQILAAHVDRRASAHGRSSRARGVFERYRKRDPRSGARGAGRRERRRRRWRAADIRQPPPTLPRRRDDRSTRVTCAIVAASGPIALASLAAGWPQSRAARERPRTRPRDQRLEDLSRGL